MHSKEQEVSPPKNITTRATRTRGRGDTGGAIAAPPDIQSTRLGTGDVEKGNGSRKVGEGAWGMKMATQIAFGRRKDATPIYPKVRNVQGAVKTARMKANSRNALLPKRKERTTGRVKDEKTKVGKEEATADGMTETADTTTGDRAGTYHTKGTHKGDLEDQDQNNIKTNQTRPTESTTIQIPLVKGVKNDKEESGMDTTHTPGPIQEKVTEASGPTDERPEEATLYVTTEITDTTAGGSTCTYPTKGPCKREPEDMEQN